MIPRESGGQNQHRGHGPRIGNPLGSCVLDDTEVDMYETLDGIYVVKVVINDEDKVGVLVIEPTKVDPAELVAVVTEISVVDTGIVSLDEVTVVHVAVLS